MEERVDAQNLLVTDSSTKTWGFRRSTIARREFMEEIGSLDMSSLPPRRSVRQARGRGRGRGRGKQACGTSAAPAPKRGRGGKKGTPVEPAHEPSPEPADARATPRLGAGDWVEAELTLQGDEGSRAPPQPVMMPAAASDAETGSEAPVSDQAEDSDELTLRELQERARKRQRLEEAGGGAAARTDAVHENTMDEPEKKQELQPDENLASAAKVEEVSSSSHCVPGASSTVQTNGSGSTSDIRENPGSQEEQQEHEAPQIINSGSSEEEHSDLCYICRQRHNNRFMICCDRCQQWLHGDCVGITLARGRLLEENGEDYICPSCSPRLSPVDAVNRPPLSGALAGSSLEGLLSGSTAEEPLGQHDDIKGNIRKSSLHCTKRKIKIFPSVEPVAAAEKLGKLGSSPPKEERPSGGPLGGPAALPRCIGPGCANEALPESVYCGHQCIIRHAAVAMQSLSDPGAEPREEPRAEPGTQTTKPPLPKPAPKIQKSFLEKLFRRKPVEKPAQEVDGGQKVELLGSLKKEDPIAAPLSSDPGRQATGEEPSSALTSSVFYQSTAVKEEKDNAEGEADLQPVSHQPPVPSASSEDLAARKTANKTAISVLSPRRSGSNSLPSRAKKTMPGSPRLAGLRLLTNPQHVIKNAFTIPKKPCQSEPVPAAPTEAPPTAFHAPELRVLPVTPAPAPPSRPLQVHPNMQMRQNVRRSLTDTLLKRANESDDLDVSESDAEKLAVNIEREMFNMYYSTDNKYKNKYRSLLLSLKDPKNKGLFYQVMKGLITPFKLTRMSPHELQALQEITSRPLKKELSPAGEKIGEPVPVSEDRAVKIESISPSGEENTSVCQVRPAQTRKGEGAVSGVLCTMLQDTTAQHRAHLFDLKCRICTGQISGDEDPETKKFKKEETKDEEEEPAECEVLATPPTSAALVTVAGQQPFMLESPASPVADDPSAETASPDYSPLVIPAVSIVTITRRDPRRASRSAPSPSDAMTSAPSQMPAQNLPPVPSEKEAVEDKKAADTLPPALLPPMPKSILMKPSAVVPRFYHASCSVSSLVSSHTPADNETSQFLSNQHTLWKGFLSMQNVAKFVTKGYLISGSAELLKKDLPDTVHVGGRILPQTVWEYIERVKTSVTKELSLIRFHPATDEEEVAYVSLFSYFNSRRRFGVVSNICNSIKDLYLIPLCAKESIPSVLLPLDGPGLEQNRPNLLIGLAICQKLKRLGTLPPEIDDKRPKIQVEPQGVNPLIKHAGPVIKQDQSEPYDPNIPISATPPGSPPYIGSPDSSSYPSSSLSGLVPNAPSDILSVVNPPTTISADTAKTTSSSAPPDSFISSSTTPLQTILNTLFGKKKQDSDVKVNTCEQSSLAVTSTVDPIVQQYQQTPKNTIIEKVNLDDNERPYDPEEEYDPATAYQSFTPSNPAEMSKPLNTLTAAANDDDRPYDPEEEYNLGTKIVANSFNAVKSVEIERSVNITVKNDDIAYDPEDDTVFEEMQTFLSDNKSSTTERGVASTVSLSEQQKMLEELNRQIEEQKRQLEEQEEALRLQRAAVGVSMAHFSVSDALMSPPPRFGREPEEATEKTLAVPAINPNRDPRQLRNVRQDPISDNLTTVHNDSEKNENWASFRRKQALTLSSFLAPSNTNEVQNMPRTEQDLVLDSVAVLQKHSNMSTATEINADDKRSTNNEVTEMHSELASTRLNASKLQEDTQSSCVNEKSQVSDSPSKVSSKTRRSRTSASDNHSSSKKRLRHERRSHHKDRTCHVSKDDTDAYRRSSRHSPVHSTRRSHSHSHRKDRSSRQRDRHHHRSTSSRHRHRRDRHSERSCSAQNGKSAHLESDQSHQRHQSPSRQSTEPAEYDTELAQSRSPATSRSPQIQGVKLQNDISKDGEQEVSEKQNSISTKSETDQSCHSAQPLSGLLGDSFTQNDQFWQREQLPLGPNSKQRDKLSQPDNEPFCHETVHHDDSKTHPPEVSPLHRGDFIMDTSHRLHHRNEPQSVTEHSLIQPCKENLIRSNKDLHCSQRGNFMHNDFSCHTDEQVLCSLQSQRGQPSWQKSDHTSHLPPKTAQIQREGLSEADTRYSRNQSLSGPPRMHRDHVSDSEVEPCFNRDLPSFQRPKFVQDAGSQSTQRSRPQRPPQTQRRDFTLDEADHCHSKRQLYMDERDVPLSEPDMLLHSSEKFLGNFPLEEEEPQLHFQHNPPHMPPEKQKSSFLKDETDQFHHQDYLPQGAHPVGRDVSQGDYDIPRDLHSGGQFRPRAPNDQWRGPRGPHSIMAPRGPSPMQIKGPRAPHPRFESCGPVQNFGPRGPYPRQRIFDDAGPSPNIGPRGPPSGPGMFKGSGPQTFGPRGSSPDSGMFEGASLHYPGPKGRFPGPRAYEGSGPKNLGPRGSSPGSEMFEEFGPSPGPCHPRHVMDRPRGPRQSRHEDIQLHLNSSEPRGLLKFQESPYRQLDNRDSQLTHLSAPRDFAARHQFDEEHCDSHLLNFNCPRGRAPPQEYDDEFFDSGDSQLPNVSRDCGPSVPFDEAEPDNRGFLQQSTYVPRRHAPPRYPDESRSHPQNSANEGFSNPQEARHHRELTPPHVQKRNQGHPRHGSPPHDQHECPRFPEMEPEIRGPQFFDEFAEQVMQREMSGPRFARPNIFEGSRGGVRDAQMKGPRFNPPQNFRGQRPPSLHFQGQSMSVTQNKQLLEDEPYSPNFSGKMTPTSTQIQRPKANVVQNIVQPRFRFSGPTKEPDIRPLRLSGPLLPTPPGGPIRLNHPRMQRPHPYIDHNWPQGPPTRGQMNELCNTGVKPGCFDDNSNHQQRETSQSLIMERQGDESVERGGGSSQDSSPGKPGKPWRRRPRRREGRSKAARRQRLRDCGDKRDNKEGAGVTDGERSRDTNPNMH